MRRRSFLKNLGWFGLGGSLPGVPALQDASAIRGARPATAAEDRAYWIETMVRIVQPVLEHLAAGRLRAQMPVETKPGADRDRAAVTHLEAFGRTMAGIAPWLALPPDGTAEGSLRARLLRQAQEGMTRAVDPASPDRMNFTEGGQPLVDAAFLAHAILRAPQVLWADLDAATQRHLAEALTSTRVIRPAYNNWILFTAMVEAALARMGQPWDRVRVDLALRKMQEWYLGDGHYSDGPEFHWDYYNSFVIHPFLLDILDVVAAEDGRYAAMRARQQVISRRYAAILERLIAPDGTYPPIGRSITYRFGAFQLLAQMALRRDLPEGVTPAQVRSGLTAVIRRTMQAGDLFDADGWLRLGLYGHQPDLAEGYISTGSLYLCSVVFLPLGLPPDDPFWTDPPADWTARRIWQGEDLPNDRALYHRDLPDA